MGRKQILSCLSALTVLNVLPVPAFAADVAGKWYGETDLHPVIIIENAGSDYSGSLIDADSTRQRMVGDHLRQEAVHKSLARLKVAGGNVRFAILKEISSNGDIDYERDQYNLTLSADGLQLVGTVSHLVSYMSADLPFTTTARVTLFSTDWNSRSKKSQP